MTSRAEVVRRGGRREVGAVMGWVGTRMRWGVVCCDVGRGRGGASGAGWARHGGGCGRRLGSGRHGMPWEVGGAWGCGWGGASGRAWVGWRGRGKGRRGSPGVVAARVGTGGRLDEVCGGGAGAGQSDRDRVGLGWEAQVRLVGVGWRVERWQVLPMSERVGAALARARTEQSIRHGVRWLAHGACSRGSPVAGGAVGVRDVGLGWAGLRSASRDEMGWGVWACEAWASRLVVACLGMGLVETRGVQTSRQGLTRDGMHAARAGESVREGAGRREMERLVGWGVGPDCRRLG